MADRATQGVLPVPAPDVETASDDYAARFAGPVGAWMLQVQERAVLELIAPWPGASVLDVGGGHAQLAAGGDPIGEDLREFLGDHVRVAVRVDLRVGAQEFWGVVELDVAPIVPAPPEV